MPIGESIQISAVIPISTSQSAAVDMRGRSGAKDGTVLVGIIMPAAWTAANLTFLAALTQAGTYRPIYTDSGYELTVEAAIDRHIVILNPVDFSSLPWIKVRSGTVALPITQDAERTITLIAKRD